MNKRHINDVISITGDYGTDNFYLFHRNGCWMVGDDVYLVIVNYSSGDTFGRSTGNLTVPHAFCDKYAAYKVVDRINNGKYGDKPGDSYACWNGYFEVLEGVTVRKFTV